MQCSDGHPVYGAFSPHSHPWLSAAFHRLSAVPHYTACVSDCHFMCQWIAATVEVLRIALQPCLGTWPSWNRSHFYCSAGEWGLNYLLRFSKLRSWLLYTQVCVIDQAPGQYRSIHALTAAPFGHVSSTVLPACAVNNTFITRTARLPTLSPFFFFLCCTRG